MTVFAYLDETAKHHGDIPHSAEVPDNAMPLILNSRGLNGDLPPIVEIDYLGKLYRREGDIRRPFPDVWFDDRGLKWTRVEALPPIDADAVIGEWDRNLKETP